MAVVIMLAMEAVLIVLDEISSSSTNLAVIP